VRQEIHPESLEPAPLVARLHLTARIDYLDAGSDPGLADVAERVYGPAADTYTVSASVDRQQLIEMVTCWFELANDISPSVTTVWFG